MTHWEPGDLACMVELFDVYVVVQHVCFTHGTIMVSISKSDGTDEHVAARYLTCDPVPFLLAATRNKS